ncbi:MAG: mismatch-specific DNA-glycosylase [Proteobacteria bacterium]|nr:mismatch-specific DNA-glycosylase [Pseudomonadota bacterium]
MLPDVLAPGLDLVLCGTAPSRISMQAGAYYATPGNLFWPTLHAVGLTPRRLAPTEYPTVLAFGIGLTDLNKTEWGSDAELTPSAFDVAGLSAKLARLAPAAVAFTSKTAARNFFGRPVDYGRQADTLFGLAWFVLPSPSGRARSHWSAAPWQALGAFVAARRRATRGTPAAAAGASAKLSRAARSRRSAGRRARP